MRNFYGGMASMLIRHESTRQADGRYFCPKCGLAFPSSLSSGPRNSDHMVEKGHIWLYTIQQIVTVTLTFEE